ncbi:hypothetical protein FACS189498_4200 [Spirochaetia bacterium]|nr:hypothetical protein FACS189498_4200 [Spirochaetia bacterium]
MGILISYFMAVTMYRPIRRLLNRFNYVPSRESFVSARAEDAYLEQQIDRLSSTAGMSETLVRNYFILNLLRNQNIDDNVNNKLFETAFNSPFYLVCLISLDGRKERETGDVKEFEAARQTIISIGDEIFKKSRESLDCVAVSPSEAAVVLHLDDGVYPLQLVPMLMEIGVAVKKYHGISVSIAVSSIVNSIYAINDSYEEAKILMKERFFNGPGQLLMKEAVKPKKEIPYPGELGEALYNAVLSGETEKIDETVKNFLGVLAKTTCDYAQMYINMLIMRFLSQNLPGGSDSPNVETFDSLFRKLRNTETLQAAGNVLSTFCHSLAADIKNKSGSLMSPLVNDSINLMKKRYADPLFSVNSAAEYFNITPSYFNRVFKRTVGISFSEYLSEYRMEIACTLLRETNNPIGSVPEAVGISNSNYFYTLFKKIYNLTPQQYRRSQKS